MISSSLYCTLKLNQTTFGFFNKYKIQSLEPKSLKWTSELLNNKQNEEEENLKFDIPDGWSNDQLYRGSVVISNRSTHEILKYKTVQLFHSFSQTLKHSNTVYKREDQNEKVIQLQRQIIL